jgi:glycosyltransferase involved in cell wall biosynthesis
MTARCSIVIPTYNEAKYIQPLLESMDRQTVKPREVIMVDGSDDGTRQIAASHGVKVLNQTVRRVSWARKRGFEAAKGEFVVSTDADTTLVPDYLQHVERIFTDKGIVAVVGPVYLADGPGVFRLMSRTLFSLFLRLSIVIGRPNLNGMNFACRKDAYDRVGGFDPEMVTGEDVYLGLKLKTVGRIVYDPRVKVYTSARRIDGMGGWRFLWHHTKNFFRVTSGKKSSGDFKIYR